MNFNDTRCSGFNNGINPFSRLQSSDLLLPAFKLVYLVHFPARASVAGDELQASGFEGLVLDHRAGGD